MATAHLKWFGAVVDLNDAELTTLTNHLSTSAASAATLSAILSGFGVTGPVAAISAIISALLGQGAAFL